VQGSKKNESVGGEEERARREPGEGKARGKVQERENDRMQPTPVRKSLVTSRKKRERRGNLLRRGATNKIETGRAVGEGGGGNS